LRSEQETRRSVETRAKAVGELSEKVRPLFIAAYPRSGSTALADYLNQHPGILICHERYNGLPRAKVTPELFTFEKILDYAPGERKRPRRYERAVKRHAELLASKDPGRLQWIGDKGQYVRGMDIVAENNPGARFIVLYRPIEEVAESWEARAQDYEDRWHSDRGFEIAVDIWNSALRTTREFIESSPAPRALIVAYHDFFYRNETVMPLISDFLELEFDESVTAAWRALSLSFAGRRRHKEPLSEEQQAFIEEHADRAAEAWVLDRIEKQWSESGLYIEESREKALSSLHEMEARAWRLQQRVNTLERDYARARRKAGQLEDLQSSRTWKLLNKLNRARIRLLEKKQRFVQARRFDRGV
jgi:hypothetical protein